MQPFRSILVDIDATAPAHPALDRAVALASSCGAKLTIADVMSVPCGARSYLMPALEEELVTERRQQLEQVARGVPGVTAKPVLLMGRPATALIQEVLRENHDLLVRSHARDLVAKPFGAVDMELFRQCPCPVLVVGPGAPPARPQILGAIHADMDAQAEQALNVRIVELTLLMAHLEQGSPVLLQAWVPFAERLVRAHSPDDAFSSYLEAARRRAADDLAHLRSSFDDRLAGVEVMLRRGEPEEVIPEFVVSQGVDLVVMGTLARTGIAGLLIGNTAERVLRKLPCSVLALKPDGFVSPVRIESPFPPS
jgi:universal stress protein E